MFEEQEANYVSKTNKIKYRPFKKQTKKENVTYEDLCKKAMNVLNYCDRTRAQLFNTLKEYGGQEQIVDNLLDELEKTGLINDEKYAQDFLEQAIKIKKIGPKKIKQNLYEKGISNEIIETVLQNYDYDTQLEVAKEFITRKMPSLYKVERNKQHQKLTASLINRGFGYSVINETINTIIEYNLNSNNLNEWD